MVPRPAQGGGARALVVNSGNANAFTGKTGRTATKLTAEIAAKVARCKPDEVFLASTGVIGEPLDATKFANVMERLVADAAPGDWHEAARAIMTTDTFPKGAAAMRAAGPERSDHLRHRQGRRHDRARHGDHAVLRLHRRADCARGSAQACCGEGVEDTFNAVTIDGDTSTSDTLLAFATGAAAARGVAKITRAADPRLAAFRKGFNAVLADLAEQVARDGEGARKLVEIVVEGAVSKQSARRIALSIANSPLVKTAIAGEDANWGRVVMAVGKAGEPADRDRLSIWFGGIRVAHKGARDPAYDEAAVSAAMKKPEITLQGRARPRQGPRPRAHLRPHQGVRGDQRGLPILADVPCVFAISLPSFAHRLATPAQRRRSSNPMDVHNRQARAKMGRAYPQTKES